MSLNIKKIIHRFLENLKNKECFVFNKVNKYINKRKYRSYEKLHLGCGDIRIKGFVNVDYRATKATDIIMDSSNLNYFAKKQFFLIYSNAFFEHLYLNDRLKCLKSCSEVLKDDGFLLFTGIPDFKVVASAYLRKLTGIMSKQFNLFEVYRYTHGSPEQSQEWWLEQLHKSLFDKETIESLLKESKFKYYCIFNYCHNTDKIPLCIGFLASRMKSNIWNNKINLTKFLNLYNKNINSSTIKIVATNN